MYEGFQHHIWEDASGILTWMGQSAYPSLVWQTYDYYYDLTGAYWGIRKACEPVHIQWSYADNSVKVINTTLKEQKGLTATGKVYNLDGKEMGRYSQSVVLDAAANKDSYCFHLNFTTDNLAFGKKAVASPFRQMPESQVPRLMPVMAVVGRVNPVMKNGFMLIWGTY